MSLVKLRVGCGAIVLFILVACSSKLTEPKDWIPKANPAHPIKDLLYYHRDTLNFYQVNEDPIVLSSIDSIIKACDYPRMPSCYVLNVWKGERNIVEFSLSQSHIENVFITNDQNDLRYLAMRYQDGFIFITDFAGYFEIQRDEPIHKVQNPHDFVEYAIHYSHATWYFKIDDDVVQLTDSNVNWRVYKSKN